MGPGRVAGYGGAGRDVTNHAALGSDSSSVSNIEMIRQPHLARENDVIAHRRAAGNADLRHDQATLSDPNVVTDVDQVVDLRSRPNHRVPDAAAIDRAVSAHFHSVTEQTTANVSD